MKRVKVDELESGMVVARSIFSSDGRILLHAGVLLNQTYISRLKSINIGSVYVEDSLFPDMVQPQEPVSEETRVLTISAVKQTFEQLEKERKLNTRLVHRVVNNLLDEILTNQQVLIGLSDIRRYDDYTFGHSVNVCVLSIMSGITMHYNDIKLKELGIGALLHDIGKVYIDPDILNKTGELTREEYEEKKKHSEYGFEVLRQYPDIPLLSAHVAFQHHERYDGHGYPRKLAGDEIHEYSRIVAVADVYDALLADRPYRSSYSINQAITILKRMAGIHLDPECTTALISNIAVYPIGTIVELNTGSIGIVVDINKKWPTRPVVRIVYDRQKRRFLPAHEIDLTKMSTIIITRTLSEGELSQLLKKNSG